MNERIYWLGFSAFSGIGPHKFKLLLDYFGSAEKAWTADEKELKKSGIGDKLSTKYVHYRIKFSLENYENRLKKAGVSFLILTDKEYPVLLKTIPNPPFVLYIRGKFDFNSSDSRMFGVVGTRKITNYGAQVTQMFTQKLAEAGFVIVSGLAIGVDSQAHTTTVQSGGKTIAVLGCGVDCCTPSSNQGLYNKIIETGGCIVSEFPLSQIPTKGSFPSRNRIIAGLSKALLVTEGAEDSGSLITADYAFKFKRPVFAIPGPVTSSLSKGPFSLIKKGAKLVVQPEDILDELKFPITNFQFSNKSQTPNSKFKNSSRDEKKILKLLENEAVHFNDLAKLTKMNSKKLGSLLSLMEVKGMIKSSDGGMFSLSS